MRYIAGILLWLSLGFLSQARADQTFNMNHTEATATTSSTEATALNMKRQYLLIINKGSVGVYAKIGSAHSGTEGVLIPAGGNWEPFVIPVGAVYLKSVSGSQSVSIVEGTR